MDNKFKFQMIRKDDVVKTFVTIQTFLSNYYVVL